jgi:hypothetical protein
MEKHHRFGCDLLDGSDAGALSATLKYAPATLEHK